MSNIIPSAVRELLEELTTDTTQDRSERIYAILAQYPESKPAPVITADTPADYSNEAIREHSRHIVQTEVFYCVSSMVDTVSKAAYNGSIDGINEEDIRSITVQDDWETPVREYLDGLDADELGNIADYIDADNAEGETEPADLEALIIARCEDDPDQWREVCDYCRLDPETVEAYEHWIVSSWLADRLAEKGQMVARDFLGLTIWGRTCTGQAIYMDSVMLEIARDALAR